VKKEKFEYPQHIPLHTSLSLADIDCIRMIYEKFKEEPSDLGDPMDRLAIILLDAKKQL